MGEINVDEMLEKISWKHFIEWLAYAQMEPFDEERQDLRIASLRSDIHNVFRGKTGKVKSPKDLLLGFGKESKSNRGWQYNKSMAYLIASSLGGKPNG